MSKFVETLGDLLFDEKIDAKTFAEKIGVAATTITRYLRGERNPSVENLVLIANYFQCSTDYLLGLEEKQNLTFKPCPPLPKQLENLLNYYNCNCFQLANDTKIHQSSVYAWKSGKRVPTVDNIIKIAKYFDCRTDFVLGRES